MYEINNFITKDLKRTKKGHLTHNPKRVGDNLVCKYIQNFQHDFTSDKPWNEVLLV